VMNCIAPSNHGFHFNPIAGNCNLLDNNHAFHFLPRTIREAVRETTELFKLDVNLAMTVALGAASTACQNLVNVRCPGFDPSPCSLYLMLMGDSTSGKTIVRSRFFRAIEKVQAELKVQLADELEQYRAELEIWKDDKQRLSSEYSNPKCTPEEKARLRLQRLQHEKCRPSEPRLREFTFDNFNPEGLRDALIANRAISIVTAEGGPALKGRVFSSPALLASTWSGESRAEGLVNGNRRPVDPRLTIILMAQQYHLEEYMKNRGTDAFESGLLGRFLLATSMSGFEVDAQIVSDLHSEPKLELFNKRVEQILRNSLDKPNQFVELTLSRLAKFEWETYLKYVNRNFTSVGYSEQAKTFFKRVGEHTARLAGIFHYFEGASENEISQDAMNKAIKVVDFYLTNWLGFVSKFSPSVQQLSIAHGFKLLNWLRDAQAFPSRYPKLKLGVYTERDLRNYSNFRGKNQDLEMAIMSLQSQGVISVQWGSKGGKVIIFPAVHNQFPQFPSNV